MSTQLKYSSNVCNRFVRDCERAGIDVEHYQGRFFWTGPAVRCPDRDAVHNLMRATRVRLQHDQLGLGWIYYPVVSGALIESKEAEV